MGKSCKNHFRTNCRISFYLTIGYENVAVRSKSDQLQIGDSIVFVNPKYSDPSLKHFIGNNLVEHIIVAVYPDNTYDTVSSRRLNFDGQGTVITDGQATLKLAVQNGKLVGLNVIKSNIAVIGGTGRYVGARGTYTNRDLGNGLFAGLLDLEL